MTPEDLSERLAQFLQRSHDARSVRIEGLRLLTGGASRQTWAFDAVIEDVDGRLRTLPLVLRSDPRRGINRMSNEVEYHLLKTVAEEGVPVPQVHLLGDDSLDVPCFLMERVDGETIPRRLLRDDLYAEARRALPAQLAQALARIHRVPLDRPALQPLPSPPPGRSPAEEELSRYEQTYRAITPEPHLTFELAFRWLRQRLPAADQRPDGRPSGRALVHGDYRIGNVIFGPEGLRAVLDWELAHMGDPLEDLGWICVRSWRFGNDHLPVGGLGSREEFWRAYEAAGGFPVDPARVRFWEVFGNLRWGVICIGQAQTGLSPPARGGSASGGSDLPVGRQVELAAIGRRTAETEWELLNLMEQP